MCISAGIIAILENTRNNLAINCSNPTTGIHPKDLNIMKPRDICITMCVLLALFTIAKIQNQPRCQISDEQIQKMWNMYIMEC